MKNQTIPFQLTSKHKSRFPKRPVPRQGPAPRSPRQLTKSHTKGRSQRMRSLAPVSAVYLISGGAKSFGYVGGEGHDHFAPIEHHKDADQCGTFRTSHTNFGKIRWSNAATNYFGESGRQRFRAPRRIDAVRRQRQGIADANLGRRPIPATSKFAPNVANSDGHRQTRIDWSLKFEQCLKFDGGLHAAAAAPNLRSADYGSVTGWQFIGKCDASAFRHSNAGTNCIQ